MSRVADEFTARFDAALRINEHDTRAATGPYERLNEFVRKLSGLADVSACLDRYLAIYLRYRRDDPRSEVVFTMLVERRIRLTPPDDDFVEALHEEIKLNRRPLSKVASRLEDLGVRSNRYAEVIRVLKDAVDKRQRSGSIIDPLKRMYRRAHEGEAAKSDEQLYSFDPWPDEALEKEYRRHVAAVTAVWDQAKKVFQDRDFSYDAATARSERERLKNSGYSGFKLRFAEFTAFLVEKRADTRAVFQLLKWARDPLRKTKEPRGSATAVKGGNADHIEYEFYAHIVLAVYINAVGYSNFVRVPEGFTAAEQRFLLDPLKRADYYSNFLNRFKLFFQGPVQTPAAQGAQAPARRSAPTSNVDAFASLATLYSHLILWGRSQNLVLVSDAELLDLQGKIKATPWQDLALRRFSTVGMSNWPYANDKFAIGARIGTGIRIAYFDSGKPSSIYLELDDAPGFLFKAHKWSFARKVAVGLYQLLWEYNKGLIRLIQKYFEIIGYMPVLVEAGVWGLVREVIQDQLIDAGLEDASRAFGKDLSSLGMIIGAVIPGPAPHGTHIDDTAHLVSAPDYVAKSSPRSAAKKDLGTLTDDQAKLTTRLTPPEVGTGGLVGTRLAGDELRLVKAPETALVQQNQRAAKATPDRPLTPPEPPAAKQPPAGKEFGEHPPTTEEVRAAKAAAERPPTPEELRAAKAMDLPMSSRDRRTNKAIDKWMEKNNPRMTRAQAEMAESKAQVLHRAAVVNASEAQPALGQTGALHAQAARARTGGGGPGTTGHVGSADASDAPRARGPRKVITVEPKPKPPAPPPKPDPPFHELSGKQVEQRELRRLVLAHHVEVRRGTMPDPTKFLSIHGTVVVDGKNVGGSNSVGSVMKKLKRVSDRRAKAGLEPLDLHLFHSEDGLINLIFANEDLLADFNRLKDLTKHVRVPEFESLNLTQKRINQIAQELDAMGARKIAKMKFDIIEIWFDRKEVQIVDITLRGNDPLHLFKTKLYKRITDILLPDFEVTAFDIKPLANGSFRWNEVL